MWNPNQKSKILRQRRYVQLHRFIRMGVNIPNASTTFKWKS